MRLVYVGHATFVIEFGGCGALLTDPLWSDRAGPLPWLGPKRFHPPGIRFEQLPPLLGAVISHNHYDHLDRATIRRLTARSPELAFLTPHGLNGWLYRQGAQQVRTADWWEEFVFRPGNLGVRNGHADWSTFATRGGDGSGVMVTAVPAQHWSKRGPLDTNRSLWCGFVIEAGGQRVYFAGDTGYGPHFREIGERLGPFDACLLPIGAYDPAFMMSTIHMNPEEAVQAWIDLGSRGLFVAMHHNVFRLSDEPPDEPVARARAEWHRLALPQETLWIPDPGESRVSVEGKAGACQKPPKTS